MSAIRTIISEVRVICEQNRDSCEAHLLKHLSILKLCTEEGVFHSSDIADLNLMHEVDLNALLDEIQVLLVRNKYLDKALSHSAFNLSENSAATKEIIISSLLYLVVIDRLTRAVINDWRIGRMLEQHFERERQKIDLKLHFNLFEREKLKATLNGIHYGLQWLENGAIRYKKWKPPINFMTLNISQAVLEDVRLGNFQNARAGLLLAMNPTDRDNAISADGNVILKEVSLGAEWIDLYMSWNLAFIAHYENYPFFFAKLLAPVVLDYHNQPNKWTYTRGMGLYLHIHHELFSRVEGRTYANPPAMTQIIKSWGQANLENSGSFLKDIHDTQPSFWRRLQSIIY